MMASSGRQFENIRLMAFFVQLLHPQCHHGHARPVLRLGAFLQNGASNMHKLQEKPLTQRELTRVYRFAKPPAGVASPSEPTASPARTKTSPAASSPSRPRTESRSPSTPPCPTSSPGSSSPSSVRSGCSPARPPWPFTRRRTWATRTSLAWQRTA